MGGVSKHRLKRALSRLRQLSAWKLALLVILFAFLGASLLRVDHLEMVRLRKAVLAADESENDEAIQQALKELQGFTLRHIVFNLIEENGEQRVVFGTGPFYLEHQYLRQANIAIEAAKKQASAISDANGNIYEKAAKVCDELSRRNGWGYNAAYIGCFQDELAKYPSVSSLEVQGDIPSTELFRYDFASPVWYPCLSGIVILMTILLVLMLIVRIVTWLVLHLAVWLVERFSH